jgi:hypothetical protein
MGNFLRRSYTVTLDSASQDNIRFSANGTGGQWWELLFNGKLNSYFAVGPSSSRTVALDEAFGLESGSQTIKGIYSLTQKTDGIALKLITDGHRYSAVLADDGVLQSADQNDKIYAISLRTTRSPTVFTIRVEGRGNTEQL